jgi:hypothetical protein
MTDHVTGPPKRSSSAAPAQGPTISASENVLENAHKYSPVRPGGASSATWAMAVGKKIISPNDHMTTVIAFPWCGTAIP